MSIEKEFVPYEQALTLKELGFDEFCFATIDQTDYVRIKGTKKPPRGSMVYDTIDCPTFSQAFRWFREKYDVYHFVTREVGINTSDIFFVASYYKGKKGNSPKDTCISSRTYEEAELECLRKLIDICKSK